MPKETRQALVYEIKKSASGNSAALFSSDGKKFYWNGKSFKKLTLGDVVFVVNPHDRWVVF